MNKVKLDPLYSLWERNYVCSENGGNTDLRDHYSNVTRTGRRQRKRSQIQMDKRKLDGPIWCVCRTGCHYIGGNSSGSLPERVISAKIKFRFGSRLQCVLLRGHYSDVRSICMQRVTKRVLRISMRTFPLSRIYLLALIHLEAMPARFKTFNSLNAQTYFLNIFFPFKTRAMGLALSLDVFFFFRILICWYFET